MRAIIGIYMILSLVAFSMLGGMALAIIEEKRWGVGMSILLTIANILMAALWPVALLAICITIKESDNNGRTDLELSDQSGMHTSWSGRANGKPESRIKPQSQEPSEHL